MRLPDGAPRTAAGKQDKETTQSISISGLHRGVSIEKQTCLNPAFTSNLSLKMV